MRAYCRAIFGRMIIGPCGVALIVLAAGLLAGCAAKKPDNGALGASKKPGVVVADVTSKPELKEKGQIVGRVVDDSGRPLPVIGAIVKVADSGGTIVSSTATDINGEFRTPPLNIGEFSITVEAGGFCALKKRSILLDGGTLVSLLCAMHPSTIITIIEHGPFVDPRSTTSGATISENSSGELCVDPQ